MIPSVDVAKVVIAELEKLRSEAHWGEVVFKVPLKEGNPQQVHVVYEKTFREFVKQNPEINGN